MERRRTGDFAVVEPDIICFVEGDSRGHSEERGEEEKTDVCFPKRFGSVCGREDPASREEAAAMVGRKKGERTRGDRRESRG